MSSRLENFIRENRESFDTNEPDPMVWKSLQEKLKPVPEKSKVFKMQRIRWIAAASILAIATLSTLFFLNKNENNGNPLVQAGKPDSNNVVPPDLLEEINPNYAKEVYHFTQIIELKQEQLKQIQKEEPELYEKFITDITKLDSSYNTLQKELPRNPNREQLLEAMIQNLRLQTELLNQQLSVIQKIKQSKTVNDETNSKSI
jgi:hypothetical protein